MGLIVHLSSSPTNLLEGLPEGVNPECPQGKLIAIWTAKDWTVSCPI